MKKHALQSKWLRLTQNPTAPKYPRTGDIITLRNYPLLPDGKYTVIMVEEFEPALHKDEDGRDIRLSLAGNGVSLSGMDMINRDGIAHGLNGVKVRSAIQE